jgi:hypothetical protein
MAKARLSRNATPPADSSTKTRQRSSARYEIVAKNVETGKDESLVVCKRMLEAKTAFDLAKSMAGDKYEDFRIKKSLTLTQEQIDRYGATDESAE